MATLNIRNLSEVGYAKLRIRAATAGRSMEAEAREIISRACLDDHTEQDALAITLSLPVWVDELFGGNKSTGVVEALIAERRLEAANE